MRSVVAALVLLAVSAAPAGARTEVTPADRAALNRTLDVFVNGAVKARNPRAAYDVVTSTLRGGLSRKAWERDIPVYPYPARGRHFHAWTLAYSEPNAVGVDLMLQPRRGAKIGPIIFGVDLKRIGSRWRVDSFIPQVTFAPPGERSRVYAPADATAPARGGGAASLAESRVSTQWLFVPLGAFGALLVLPFALWLAARRRDARAVEAYRAHRTGRGRV